MLDRFGVFHSDFPDVELPNKNIWQFLYPRLKKWGDLTAIIDSNSGEEITYNELIERSLCWGKELRKFFKGTTPPTVVFMLANNAECIPLIWGCFAVGAILCPIRHDSVKELFQIMIKQLQPDVMVTESSIYDIYKATIRETGLNPHVYVAGDSSAKGVDDFDRILYSRDSLGESEAGQFDLDSVAMIVYSSGTTGNPKGIVMSHRALPNTIATYTHKLVHAIKPADEGEQETIVCNVPFAHVFGIQYFSIVVPWFGCRIVYFDFKRESYLTDYVQTYKPKLLITRPDVVNTLSKIDCRESLASVRTIMVAGSPSNAETFKILNRMLGNYLIFQDCYGSTECNTIAITPFARVGLGMTGKLVSNCRARLVDPDTGENIMRPHHLGEILFKGPGMMIGYLNNPEATNEVIDSEGWYHTGDMAYFDEEHFFKVIDRFKDLITVCVDGKVMQVSPTTIESILKEHPGVLDAGVIGVADLETGEEVPKAFVIREDNHRGERPVTEEELITFVEERAAKELRLFGGVEFVKHLPRNHFGKLVRKFLRNMTWFK